MSAPALETMTLVSSQPAVRARVVSVAPIYAVPVKRHFRSLTSPLVGSCLVGVLLALTYFGADRGVAVSLSVFASMSVLSFIRIEAGDRILRVGVAAFAALNLVMALSAMR
jgi:hypothetical protein